MFGFPFVTSLIVVMALVTICSLVINKGLSFKPKAKQADLVPMTKKHIQKPA